MSNVPHLPVLRLGRSYESLDKLEIKDHRTGEVKAVVSSINAGILRKDFRKLGDARAALKKFTVAQLVAMSAKAGAAKPLLKAVKPLLRWTFWCRALVKSSAGHSARSVSTCFAVSARNSTYRKITSGGIWKRENSERACMQVSAWASSVLLCS
jgi:hypothetical protein